MKIDQFSIQVAAHILGLNAIGYYLTTEYMPIIITPTGSII
ncbi:hypothetical protein [Erysipelothrix anatis]|nr:hypothetical protein [Erysipelothrix anatis]